MELAGINNEETFNRKVVREQTSDPKSIEAFKNGIYKGINGKPGVYYKGKGDMKYAVLSSGELYPNSERFKDEGKFKHQFIINSTGKDYMEIVIQYIESCFSDGIPFYVVVRLPEDMKNGYPDPIRVYCTDKSLQATIDELERMTYVCKDKLEEPDWRIAASINGLYGYTQMDVNNGGKTPMNTIFDTITKVVDQELTEYDALKGNTAVSNYDWKTRVVKLLKMKAMDNDRYEQILDDVMKYLSELNIDLDNIFEVPTVNNLDQDIQDMDKMLTAIDSLVETKEEVKEEAVEPVVEQTPVVDEAKVSYQLLADALVRAREVAKIKEEQEAETKAVEEPTEEVKADAISFSQLDDLLTSARAQAKEMPVAEEVMPIKEVEPPFELPPVGPVADVMEPQPELFNKLNEALTNARSYEENVDDHDWSNITNAPVDEEIEEPDRMEVTQAYTPITDEMVLGSDEPKKNTPPVLPDDVKEVDPSEMEDEFVSLDTGSYAALPVEVTGFDNDEVKSIVNAPQAGQAVNMHDAVVALNEYDGMISTNEALQNVVNSKGENVSLIDYLTFEGVSSKVPFESTVVLNDGSEITGKEFIQKYVIPVVKQNTTDKIFTVDQIVNNYSTEVRYAAPEKKGFFAKLFGKKK
jgi:hypothetical protein